MCVFVLDLFAKPSNRIYYPKWIQNFLPCFLPEVSKSYINKIAVLEEKLALPQGNVVHRLKFLQMIRYEFNIYELIAQNPI